jgi:hypothetical protein
MINYYSSYIKDLVAVVEALEMLTGVLTSPSVRTYTSMGL